VVAGTLTRLDNNLLRLEYDESYRRAADAPPSVSLPLAIRTHTDTPGHRTVSNFLWGLLPDSDLVLTRWSQHFQVRATSPFFLGTPVGEDCAGAVTFCPPDQLDRHRSRRGSVRWLSTEEVPV
jgi:serine/threonine-protein kinase HipA